MLDTEWERLAEIFETALGLSAEERVTYLDSTCGRNAALRAQIDSLLRHADAAPDFLNRLAGGVLQPAVGALLEQQAGEDPYAQDPLVGTFISHYRIEERLGGGGMGIVYKARDIKLDRTVALKFLPIELTRDTSAKERFVLEAQAASALDHPNICTIHDIDASDDGRTFIAMGFVDGENLKNKIGRGPLPVPEAVDYMVQIADALSAAHEKGIIHRDVKPANVMITREGHVKLVDFGLVKLADRSMTRAGSTLGTIAYMSPEQVRGEPVDSRTDLWSLGVVLYEMLTGKQPFRGEHEMAILYAIVNNPVPPVRTLRPDVPDPVVRVVERLLERRLEARYASAVQVIRDLKPPSDAPVPMRSSRSRIRYILPLASAVAVLIILLFLLWSLKPWQQERRTDRAGASTPSLAVMYFENQTPEQELERILVNLLTTNLARYDSLEVVSSQRLFDILKQLGQQDAPFIDQDVATEVAQIASVEWMLLGSIIQLGERIRINAQLVDARTGQIVTSVQENGNRVDDIFTMVDRLTENIAGELNLETRFTTLKVTDVTTDSYVAFKHYQEGIERSLRWEWEVAREAFKRAAAIDTTFALAYARLGTIACSFDFWQTGSHAASPVALDYLSQARRHAFHATEPEQLMIEAWSAQASNDLQRASKIAHDWVLRFPNDKHAHFYRAGIANLTGDRDVAIDELQRVLELDPVEPLARNLLAYTYAGMGNYPEAISHIQQYVDLQPNVMNTYDSAWEIYVIAGRLDEAVQITEEALRRDPKWSDFYRMAGDTRLLQDRPAEAREAYLHLQESGQASMVEARLGLAYAYEGRYDDAQRAMERVLKGARAEGDTMGTVHALVNLGNLNVARNRYAAAVPVLAEAEQVAAKMENLPLQIRALYYAGRALLRSGDAAGFNTRMRRLRALTDKLGDPAHRDFVILLEVEQFLEQGKGREARDRIEQVSYLARSYLPQYLPLLAESQRASGDFSEAQATLEKNAYGIMRQRYGGDALSFFLERSMLDYRLGILFEQLNVPDEAVRHYQIQLQRWQQADEDFPVLEDTRSRLARLESTPV